MMSLMWMAGEASGDHHAAAVLDHLAVLAPDLKHFGYGGERMAARGVDVRFNLARDLPIIGLSGVLANYPKLRRLFKDAVRMLREERPTALVCVDYPGFNLRLAAEAHRLGVPVIWYIAPQVWAWKEGRVEKMRKYLQKVFVILPFEEEFLRKRGVNAEYTGHPLLDSYDGHTAPSSVARRQLGLAEDRPVLGLLPGSRRGEIRRHLQPVLEAAARVQKERPQMQFVMPRAETVAEESLREGLARFPELQVTLTGDVRTARLSMDAALCKSGTSTLDLTLDEVPMIIYYKTSALTALVFRRLVKIPHVGLVNIIAGRMLCPELIQEAATAEALAKGVLPLLEVGSAARAAQLSGMREVKQALGGEGAGRRVAEGILAQIGG